MTALVNRLRGEYDVGKNKEFGTRSFSNFIPPIALEAASRIEELERVLRKANDQIYDNPILEKLIEDTLS